MRFLDRGRRVWHGLLRRIARIDRLAQLRRFARRRRWVVRTAAIAAAGAAALFVASALGILAGSPSNFEANDGNLTVDHASSADWNCFTKWPTTGSGAITVGSGTCSSKIEKSGYFQEASNPLHVDPTAGTKKDISWKSGQKQDTSCPVLEESKSPEKDTLTNVGQYVETEVNGSGELGATYLYGATTRPTANGNSSENVELNQVGPNKNCSINRTQGDHMIAINYLGGGSSVEFAVLTWVSNPTGSSFTDSSGDKISGTCKANSSSSVSPSGCWSETVKEITGTTYAEGSTNTNEIKAPENGLTNEKLESTEFAEFGVNLEKAGVLPRGTCEGFADTVYESRSSGSGFTSNPEDIEIVEKPINNCGTIKVIKATNPAGLNKVFGFTSTLPHNAAAGGVNSSPCTSAGIGSSGEFCLNAASSASGGNKVTATKLAPTTYKIGEGEEPSGFLFEGVKCVNEEGTTVASSESSAEVSLPLHPGETITCTYTNREELGALKIIKENSKSLKVLEGAEFEIKNPSGTKLKNSTGGTTFTTNSKGEICVDNLTPVGEYTAEEIKAPSKYGVDGTNPRHVTVTDVGAEGCKAATFAGQTLTFLDPPLTDLTVTAKSEVASPDNTKSKVSCTDNESHPNSFNSGSTFTDPATASHEGYRPGTYTVTCTVEIDP
jgi:hypothetical protein